jgi:hypothetical protein
MPGEAGVCAGRAPNRLTVPNYPTPVSQGPSPSRHRPNKIARLVASGLHPTPRLAPSHPVPSARDRYVTEAATGQASCPPSSRASPQASRMRLRASSRPRFSPLPYPGPLQRLLVRLCCRTLPALASRHRLWAASPPALSTPVEPRTASPASSTPARAHTAPPHPPRAFQQGACRLPCLPSGVCKCRSHKRKPSESDNWDAQARKSREIIDTIDTYRHRVFKIGKSRTCRHRHWIDTSDTGYRHLAR